MIRSDPFSVDGLANVKTFQGSPRLCALAHTRGDIRGMPAHLRPGRVGA